MKTVIINTVGFDGGGIARLGIEYSKLGFDVYFKNTIKYLQIKPTNIGEIKFYDDLHLILPNYDRAIFLTFYDDNLQITVRELITLKKKFSNIEFWYLYCDRNLVRLEKLLSILKEENFNLFDGYFSINPNIFALVNNYVYLNVNAYTFKSCDMKPLNERKRIVLTAGRTEGFKGVLLYFSFINKEFLDTDYYYIHEGANFSFNKFGRVSVPPQLLNLFDTNVSPKVIKPEFSFNKYGDEPVFDKFTIYPSYNSDSIMNRWSNYYAGICCILGSKSISRPVKNLIGGYNWVLDDKIENTLINKKCKIWNDAIEYANIEMIEAGLPVLFSRKYSQIIGFSDEHLIYDAFSMIPLKLDELMTDYNSIREKQYTFFVKKQTKINNYIKKVFVTESRYLL